MLTRLPGSKWWIETDDVTFEIIGTYNKAAITADIQSINYTLTLYPDATQEALDVLMNKMVTDPTTGIMTLYDDAGNPLLTAQLYEDAAGLQTYRGKGAERRERLA